MEYLIRVIIKILQIYIRNLTYIQTYTYICVCDFTCSLIWKILIRAGHLWRQNLTIREKALVNLFNQGSMISGKDFKKLQYLFFATNWTILYHRNKIKFEMEKVDRWKILESIKFKSLEWFKATNKKSTLSYNFLFLVQIPK